MADQGYTSKLIEFLGMDERPADLAAFSYNELCFLFDNFYGNPGRGLIADDLYDNGLDHALQTHGDDTRKIREFLKSTDVSEYYAVLPNLSSYVYDGGHTETRLWSRMMPRYTAMPGGSEFFEKITGKVAEINPYSPPEKQAVMLA